MAQLLAKAAAAGIAAASDADDDDGDDAYLWPECVPAWEAFIELGDQWRDGVLPRSEILAHLREVLPAAAERAEVYACVCACARAVRRVHDGHQAAERNRSQQRRHAQH